ncbi:hypothetical protein [Streptosporangium sp. KLBMP 9127]|nr:hypothetical protein [Streptosporangium sp. KLBMP 9127]
MTHPLTDRSRSELITELYDRHATGLFAYCHDQLGDAGAAADALISLLTGVPAVPPPRAGLYALARREIYRRDIVYCPPLVDPAADPATALVERVLRELRAHQREVLLLSVVCGLTIDELAWVLDVAADTAAELVVSADHHFTQTLSLALTGTGPVPGHLTDVYGALAVAPSRDVLARLPWRPPPALLRAQVFGALGVLPRAARAKTSALPVKPLWPTTPAWPVPLGDTDDVTNAGVYEVGVAPPPPGRVSPHEATTEPMPRLHGAPLFRAPASAPVPADMLAPNLLDPLPPARRPGMSRHRPMTEPADLLDPLPPSRRPTSQPADLPDSLPPSRRPTSEPADLLDPLPPSRRPDTLDPLPRVSRQVPADVLDNFPLPRHVPADVLDGPVENLFQPPPRPPRPARAPEPVYLMPLPTEEDVEAAGETTDVFDVPILDPEPEAEPVKPKPVEAEGEDLDAAKAPAPLRYRAPERGHSRKYRRVREHHHDWAWEVIGFVICLALALIVFFAVPTIVTP